MTGQDSRAVPHDLRFIGCVSLPLSQSETSGSPSSAARPLLSYTLQLSIYLCRQSNLILFPVNSTLPAVRPASDSSAPFFPLPVFNNLRTLFSSASSLSHLTPCFSDTSAHFPVAPQNRKFLSFVFFHLRTLCKRAFCHLVSFQPLPHSLQKNRAVPHPPRFRIRCGSATISRRGPVAVPFWNCAARFATTPERLLRSSRSLDED